MADSLGDIDGLRTAHLAPTLGIIAKLKARGLLSEDDLVDVIDQATLGLEEWGLNDPVRESAHANLGLFLAMFLGKPYPTQT